MCYKDINLNNAVFQVLQNVQNTSHLQRRQVMLIQVGAKVGF